MSYYNKEFTFIDLMRQVGKRKWLITIITVIFAIVSFYMSSFVIPNLYESDVTIFIGKESGVLAEFNFLDLQIGEQLIEDYKELIKTKTVRHEVVELVDRNMDPKVLLDQVSIRTVQDSRFMVISVLDRNPDKASRIANAIAEVLILKAEAVIGAKNIQIVDAAIPINEPVSPNVVRFTLVFTMIGLLVGFLISIIMVLMDTKVNNQDDIEYYLKVTFLGQTLKVKSGKSDEELVLRTNKNSYDSELYKLIRTNLDFMTMENEKKTIMFTSSQASEGKTTTIANLAVAFSQIGKKVLIIDSDLRKPRLHKIYNLTNSRGLTNIIVNRQSFDEVVKRNVIKNLDILTSGPVPPNPNELLMSKKVDALFNHVKGIYDLILIDSPPVLPVADSLTLARDVDGVVLVVACKQTKKDDMVNSVKNIEKINVPILGLILAKVNVKKNNYYYY